MALADVLEGLTADIVRELEKTSSEIRGEVVRANSVIRGDVVRANSVTKWMAGLAAGLAGVSAAGTIAVLIYLLIAQA